MDTSQYYFYFALDREYRELKKNSYMNLPIFSKLWHASLFSRKMLMLQHSILILTLNIKINIIFKAS